MSSQAQIGAGTKLKKGNGASPEVFTAIAELLTLEKSGRKIDLVEVTNMDSAANAQALIFKEFIKGLADGGEVKFSANYLPSDTTQQDFNNAFDGVKKNWQIVLPGALGTWAFSGFVTAADHKFPLDKQMEITGTIKITGPDTFA